MGDKKMTAAFPAGAFALGIFLFSGNMQEGFTAGILLVFASVLAMFLRNFLDDFLPRWSVRICLWIAVGSLTEAAFDLSFYALGTEKSLALTAMTAFIGILAGEEIYCSKESSEMNELMWECSVVWAIWIAAGAFREFMASGTVFLYPAADIGLASGSFQKAIFAFITAGTVLAVSCLILGRSCACDGYISWFAVIPAVVYIRPFDIPLFGAGLGAAVSAAVALVFFFSVKKQQEGTLRRKVLSGIPAEMTAMGIIYMILGMY